MKLRSLQKEEPVSVQMAPLIDCVFILLIFFLVTSMLQKPHKELPIVIPDAGAAEKANRNAEEPYVIVLATKNPDVTAPKGGPPRYEPYMLVGEEELTRDMLEARLRQIAADTPNRPIRIDAFGRLPWRHIVPIVNLCRFYGLSRVDVRVP